MSRRNCRACGGKGKVKRLRGHHYSLCSPERCQRCSGSGIEPEDEPIIRHNPVALPVTKEDKT